MTLVDASFSWGDRNPTGGYKVGDRVGVIHSDHESYIFDDPTGTVVAVEDEDRDLQWITVRIEVEVPADRAYLISREMAG